MIVHLGERCYIRFYDIVSIIFLSVFANKMCDISQFNSRIDFIILFSSLSVGICMAIVFSIYSYCHEKTNMNKNKESYSQSFADFVKAKKITLIILWLVVLIGTAGWVYGIIMSYKTTDNLPIPQTQEITQDSLSVNATVIASPLDTLCSYN